MLTLNSSRSRRLAHAYVRSLRSIVSERSAPDAHVRGRAGPPPAPSCGRLSSAATRDPRNVPRRSADLAFGATAEPKGQPKLKNPLSYYSAPHFMESELSS